MTFEKIINKYIDIEHVARKLIIHHTKLSTSDIFKDIDQEIDFDLKLFVKDIDEYIAGKPLQYILGYEHFLDLKINVKKGVYIPRPETEKLTEEVLIEIDELFGNQEIIIADICSGSGAIALALNYHTKQKTYGLELSQQALSQARENNKLNKCQVQFEKSDIDSFLLKNNIKVDVLISNPPYIKRETKLESRVQDYEPHMALFDKDPDGLSFYKKILSNHYQTTKEKAIIAFEFGYDQKESIEKLIKENLPSSKYIFIYDYNDNPRGVIIKK